MTGLTVVTDGYPNNTITNPSCDCQFSTDEEGLYIQAITECRVGTWSIPLLLVFPLYLGLKQKFY